MWRTAYVFALIAVFHLNTSGANAQNSGLVSALVQEIQDGDQWNLEDTPLLRGQTGLTELISDKLDQDAEEARLRRDGAEVHSILGTLDSVQQHKPTVDGHAFIANVMSSNTKKPEDVLRTFDKAVQMDQIKLVPHDKPHVAHRKAPLKAKTSSKAAHKAVAHAAPAEEVRTGGSAPVHVPPPAHANAGHVSEVDRLAAKQRALIANEMEKPLHEEGADHAAPAIPEAHSDAANAATTAAMAATKAVGTLETLKAEAEQDVVNTDARLKSESHTSAAETHAAIMKAAKKSASKTLARLHKEEAKAAQQEEHKDGDTAKGDSEEKMVQDQLAEESATQDAIRRLSSLLNQQQDADEEMPLQPIMIPNAMADVDDFDYESEQTDAVGQMVRDARKKLHVEGLH